MDDPETVALLTADRRRVAAVARRIAVSREFRVLGTRPPAWQPVQAALDEACARLDPGPVAVRAWAARLEVYADPALPVAFYHLLHNATRPGTGATAVVITYRRGPEGCRIIVEDDGLGVPAEERDTLFSPASRPIRPRALPRPGDPRGSPASGSPRRVRVSGARFVLTVPHEGCRVA